MLVLLRRALALREVRAAVAKSRDAAHLESPPPRHILGHTQATVCILNRAGFTDKEIAGYMGSTVGAVRRLREYALKQLRRRDNAF